MTTVEVPTVTCPNCEKAMKCEEADNVDMMWVYRCTGCGLSLDLVRSEDDE
jgi:hypothetical protein